MPNLEEKFVYMKKKLYLCSEFQSHDIKDEPINAHKAILSSVRQRIGRIMVTFSFREYGENLGTRPLGQRVREQLMPLLEQEERVVLDFTGVNVVSNSFADECIAKLLLTMPLSELKSRTTFRGLNPIASASVLTALQRRHIANTRGTIFVEKQAGTPRIC